MFFFRKKTIVVDAFTSMAAVHEFYPIKPARNFFPDWWKQMPSHVEQFTPFGVPIPHATIKRCEGFIDLYKNGFVIPLWSDLNIKTTKDGSYGYVFSASNSPQISQHPSFELGDEFKDLIHMKMYSPWILQEKTGLNFVYKQPFWNQIDLLGDVFTPPGVINYKHQITTNVNLLFKKQDKIYNFQQGMPLAHIIPMSENEVNLKTHLIDVKEFNLIQEKYLHRGSFLNKYKKMKNLHDKIESKCPFGFGE